MKKMNVVLLAIGLTLFVQAAPAQWTAAKRLTWNLGNSENPVIAVGPSGHLHVVWWDTTPGHYEIYYTKSTDGGANWKPSQRLTWTDNSSIPAIAVDSLGQLHVVWCNNSPGNGEIYYKKSTDGGATWSPNQRLTWTSGQSLMPAIVVDPFDYLHVVWSDNTSTNYEIYYRRSTDGGATWTPNKRLTWTADSSYIGDMAMDTLGNPHIVWEDLSPYEVFYKRGIDGGLTWATSQRLTWNSGGSGWPSVAVESSGHIHVVWEDGTPLNIEVFYRRSLNLGLNWAAGQRLTWNSSQSRFPAVAADSDANVHVVWEDDISGDFEIYYRKSSDSGASWAASQRLTWTSSWSQCPAIKADPSGNLHLVWHDSTPGNAEIYYKKYVN